MTARGDRISLPVLIGLMAVVYGLGTATLSLGNPDACGKPGAVASDRSEDQKPCAAGAGTARTEASARTYVPPPESAGGWRMLDDPDSIRRLAGMDPDRLK